MVQNKHIQSFLSWCQREHIRVTLNNEIFFINERKTVKPTFKLGNNIFVYIADGINYADDDAYNAFAKSFNTIIVILEDDIEDFCRNISRRDIIKRFNVSL